MKKHLPTLLLLLGAACASAQPTAGLIAHWDMNGTTNDVTIGGHNGHGISLTTAAGMDGVPGHAWYFNGTSSGITIPASPAFNITHYSISATIKPMGYYMGPCHANMLLTRGQAAPNVTGNYYFDFSDDPAGFGCTTSTVDTNQESFMTASCGSPWGLVPTSNAAYNTSTHIISNVWQQAVVTFNDTVYKMYVNGVLMATVPITTPGVPIGSSGDSMSIGFAVYDAAVGYPYYFKGVIDDILFYDRVLSDTEVVLLHHPCGSIITQPVSVTAPAAGTVTYSVTATIPGGSYQWQQNTGSGYANLSNTAPYSGTNTNTLTITGITTAMNAYHYRCVVSNESSCFDTSAEAALTLSVSHLSNTNIVTIYPNPAHNTLTLSATSTVTDIVVSNLTGQVVYTAAPDKQTTDIDLTNFANGVYFIRINKNEVRKLIKQ